MKKIRISEVEMRELIFRAIKNNEGMAITEIVTKIIEIFKKYRINNL